MNEENRLSKSVYRTSLSLILGVMILANLSVAFAESSRAGNGGTAQVHVRFKIVVAPILSMDTAALSTYALKTESNASRRNLAITPVNKTPSYSRAIPSTRNYMFAESPEKETKDSRQMGLRSLILCSP